MNSSYWIDSHSHLFDLTERELEESIDRCKKQNVLKILNISTDIKTSAKVVEQVKKYPELLGALGISPFDSENINNSWLQDLTKLLKNEKIIALGEIGLDNTNPSYPPLSVQLSVFLNQLDIAKNLNLPVLLHSRGAEKKILKYLKAEGIKKAVFHCYTGPSSLISEIIKENYFISYSGIATFKKCELDDQIKATPLEYILIETDSPYLAPVPYRGKKNEPSFVATVGERIAQLKNCSINELQKQIIQNYQYIFETE